MEKILFAKHLVLKDRVAENQFLRFSERIEDLFSAEEAKRRGIEAAASFEYILPGFIDVHIHGSGGADVMDGTPEALETIAKTIARAGTTSYLPTTMTMSEEKICRALENIRETKRAQEERGVYEGARILGAHLEGPFISLRYKGAQAAEHIQKPNDRWLKNYYDIVKLITMAPEEDEGFAMIREWSSKGIVVSVGHTDASYETALEAYRAGARHITHLFNAMTPLHHRKPGVVSAALNEHFNVEMITDGFHIHPDVIRFVTNCKSREEILLITDCMRAGFTGDGESELGGQKVFVKGDQCLLENGTIAGSIHRTDKALQNVLKFTSCSLPEVAAMLSLNPARDLGLDEEYGSLECGKFADFVCMDESLNCLETWVAGRKVFGGEAASDVPRSATAAGSCPCGCGS